MSCSRKANCFESGASPTSESFSAGSFWTYAFASAWLRQNASTSLSLSFGLAASTMGSSCARPRKPANQTTSSHVPEAIRSEYQSQGLLVASKGGAKVWVSPLAGLPAKPLNRRTSDELCVAGEG